MVKNLKYIINRILIGVGIALLLGFIRGNFFIGVSAKSSSSIEMDYRQSLTTDNYTLPLNSSWANWGWGTLTTTLYISTNSNFNLTTNTELPWFALPRQVSVSSGSEVFVCDIGSATYSNDMVYSTNPTYGAFVGNLKNQASYTISCSVNSGLQGINALKFYFGGVDGSGNTVFRIGPYITFTTDDDLNSSINNQISNDNSNTQNIINNQNSNNEQQIDSQKVCNVYDNSKIDLDNRFLGGNGSISSNSNYAISNFIDLQGVISITVLQSFNNSSRYFCFYDKNKTVISCAASNTLVINDTLTVPTDSKYFRFTIYKTSNVPQFNICRNGNQAIAEATNNNTNAINNVNDTLNNDDPVSDSDITSIFDDLQEDSSTPVSDLLLMPLTLINAYITGFSDTCQEINLGRLYGTYLIIPCINIENHLGSELWGLIDVLFTIFMVYEIGMLLVSCYEGLTSLSDDMQYLYSPRHAGGGSTRVERYGDSY